MKINEILNSQSCTLLSEVKKIDLNNKKDIDVLCNNPAQILQQISKSYKILWSQSNRTGGTTNLIWDEFTKELFRIDLAKKLYLVTQRVHPYRVKASKILDVTRNSENVDKFKLLRQKIKQHLKNYTVHEILDECLNHEEKGLVCLEKVSIISRLKWKIQKLFSKPKKIVFLGPDGAGKSTLISSFISDVSGGYGNVKYIHLKLPFPTVKNKEKKQIIAKPHSNNPYGYVKSSIKYIYLLIQYVYGLIFINIRYSSKDLIIFDRYYYDIFVDPRRFRLRRIKLLEILIKNILPSPDLVLVVTASAETMFKRKQDLTIEEIRRQLSEYQKVKGHYVHRLINEKETLNKFCDKSKNLILNNL